MQFKVITGVLLFFVAQTMATPNPQTADIRCTLPLMASRQRQKLMTLLTDTTGYSAAVS